MKNPLSVLPMFDPSVPDGTFRRAFTKGAGTGMMMMGIFAGVMTVAGFALPLIGITAIAAPTITSALAMMGTGAVSTGLFSGVTAAQKAAGEVHSAANDSHPAHRQPVGRSQGYSPANDTAPTRTGWGDRIAAERPSGRDNLSQIITDRSMSDRDRAAAILRDREQSGTLESAR